MDDLAGLELRFSTISETSFKKAAVVLQEIEDRKLYRPSFKSLRAYVDASERIHFSGQTAKRILKAWRVARLLGDTPLPQPSNERQIRSLAGKSKDVIEEVWSLAHELAQEMCIGVTGELVDGILKERDTLPTSRLRLFMSSRSNCHYTPNFVVELVRSVFQGTIDLDPASDSIAQTVVKATTHYTVEQDGLSMPWCGRVFCNPPFGTKGISSVQHSFFKKGLEEFKSGEVTEAVFLLKAAVCYEWFHEVMQHPFGFLNQRLRFGYASENSTVVEHEGANPHGSVVVYLGKEKVDQDRFVRTFKDHCRIPGLNTWAAGPVED